MNMLADSVILNINSRLSSGTDASAGTGTSMKYGYRLFIIYYLPVNIFMEFVPVRFRISLAETVERIP